MTINDIITELLNREGGSKVTSDPHDKGGRTQYGISEKYHPDAWKDGHVTEAEARSIYFNKYVKGPGYDKIPASHTAVLEQLVDFGVNSGPAIATAKLQGLLGVATDGVFGPRTLKALLATDARLINNALVRARIGMICSIVQDHPAQLRFLEGWVKRALEFIK